MKNGTILFGLLAFVAGACLLLAHQWQREPASSPRPAPSHLSKAAPGVRAAPLLSSATAQPAWVARGVVRSSRGGILAKARVCALMFEATAQPTCVGSDASGQFSLRGSGSAPIALLASAPGHASRRVAVDERAADATLTLTLEPSRAEGISGHVVDMTGGPVIGARVMAWDSSAHAELAATAESDDEGAFSLALAGGAWLLEASAEAYSVDSRWVQSPARDTALTLVPASELSGRVVLRGSGEPVPGVGVQALGSWGAEVPSAISDGTGAFRFDALSAGNYQLVVRDERFRSEPRSVQLAVGQAVDSLQIEVSASASLVGWVSTARGACASGRVELLGPVSSASAIEAEGAVRFEALPPGSYQVSVYCDGSLPEFDSLTIGAEPLERRWQVDAGLSVRGLARRASGRALAGARIVVDPVEAPGQIEAGPRLPQSNCVADAEGRFECGGLVAGEYACLLSPDRFPSAAPVRVSLTAGTESTVLLEAPASGTLAVTLSAEAEQASAAHVFARRQGQRETLEASRSGSRFVFDELPLGAYEIFVGPPDLDGEAAGRASLARDEERVEVALDSARPQTLRGVVLDPDGAPVPDAWVSAESEWEPDLSSGRPRVLTDERGQFVLGGIWPGRQRVSASSPLGEASLAGVRAGASDVTLRLEARASLSGSVQTPAGQPVPQFSLEYMVDSSSGGALRGHDGHFALSMLRPGSYALRVASSDGSASVAGLVVAPGQSAEVVLTVQPD